MSLFFVFSQTYNWAGMNLHLKLSIALTCITMLHVPLTTKMMEAVYDLK